MKRRDENGVTHVIEFTLALTVFILMFQAFTTTMDYRLGIDLDKHSNRISESKIALNQLIGSTGSVNNETDWDEYEYGIGEIQIRHDFEIGILNENGNVDIEKCHALAKLPRPFLNEQLGVTENLEIKIISLVDGEEIVRWGSNSNDAQASATSYKFVILEDGEDTFPGRVDVTVFKGPIGKEKIVVTEIMYAPENDYDNYEWIEIYNPMPYALDLNDLKISDLNESDYLKRETDTVLTIPSGAVGIIVVNETFFRENILVPIDEDAYIFEVEDSAIGNGLDIEDEITIKYSTYEQKIPYSYETSGAFRNGNSLNINCLECDEFIENTITPGTYETE